MQARLHVPLPLHVPSPTLPIKGRMPLRVRGAIEQKPLASTLPFMGRDGEGMS
jgi:hypothetical protein